MNYQVDSTFRAQETQSHPSKAWPILSRKPFSRLTDIAQESLKRACVSSILLIGCLKRMRSQRNRESHCRHRPSTSSSTQSYISPRTRSRSFPKAAYPTGDTRTRRPQREPRTRRLPLCAANGMADDRLEVFGLRAARVAQVNLVMQPNVWHSTVRIESGKHARSVERDLRGMSRR